MVKAKSPSKYGTKKISNAKIKGTPGGKVTKFEGTKSKKKEVIKMKKRKSVDHSETEVGQELNGSKKSVQEQAKSSEKLIKQEGSKDKKAKLRKRGKRKRKSKTEGTQKVNGVKKFPPKATAGRNLKKKGKADKIRNDDENIIQISSEKEKETTDLFLKRKTEGAIVITNLPHGFYENEMLDFFKQFGVVTNLRLARSKKNGKPMGFAFVGFHVPEVAKIVANTLDGYLMFNKILKCKYIRKSEIKVGMFKWKRRTVINCLGTKRRIKAVEDLTKIQSKGAECKRIQRLAKKVEKSKTKLKTLGITLDLQTPSKPAKKEQAVEDNLLEMLDMVPDQTEEEDGGEFFMDNKQFIELKRKIAEKLLADVEREEETIAETTEERNEIKKKDVQEVIKEESLNSASKNISDCAAEESLNLVLEVDESDDEVQIKTPPNYVKKRVKMTPSTPSTPVRHDTPRSQKKTPLQNMSAKKRMKNQDSKGGGVGDSGKKKKRKIEDGSL